MKKNRWLWIVLPLLVASLACTLSFDALNWGNAQAVRGSGNLESEERELSPFYSIELDGSANVDVGFGDEQSVIVETDDNILPLIKTEVSGNTLVIRTEPNTAFTTIHPVKVTVILNSLKSVILSGSGNISISEINEDSLRLELPGSGNITVSGSVNQVAVSLKGSGDIKCGDLESKLAEVRLNGSGSVTVYALDDLDIEISGSGSVFYRGTPANITKSIPGSGSVKSIP